MSEYLYRPVELDRRHSGYTNWKYYIEPLVYTSSERFRQFHEWRKWCWETYGESMERDRLDEEKFHNYKWSWFVYNGIYRIYFKSEKELNWFKLRWPNIKDQ